MALAASGMQLRRTHIQRAGNAMKMLATTYGALGRIDESLALKEQTLQFELRVLPANHPHIGDTLAPARGSFMLTHGQAAGRSRFEQESSRVLAARAAAQPPDNR